MKQYSKCDVMLSKSVESEGKIRPNYYLMKDGKDLNDLFEMGLLSDPAPWYVGNVIKYVTRYNGKNGKQDLIKANTYLDRLIKYVGGEDELQQKSGDQ